MRWTVLLEQDSEAGYGVMVPALPGCFSRGDTVDEALVNVSEAIALHLEGMLEAGEDVPDEAVFFVAEVRVPVPELVHVGS